ncbi:MAG TPA: hypothetical protein VFT16_05535 [Candidatus Saccharimonadales bacterium]|nr:hypothetical protein [Candidatus Saccharimonadales bacterium]
MRSFWRKVAIVLTLAVGATTMTGCFGQDDSALGQIKPGQTVFADLWNEDNQAGDEALVEQKPSGLWVIDTSVNFRGKRQKNFDVQIKLDKATGAFKVLDMGNTKVGKDHDDCLSVQDPEHYATMVDTSITFEKDKPESGDNNDCLVATDKN